MVDSMSGGRWLRRLLIALAAVGVMVGVAAPAGAASATVNCCIPLSYIWSDVSDGAWLRAQPSTSAYGMQYMPDGRQVIMICWVDAQWVHPPNTNYSSNRWFKVEPTYDPAVGYVHSALVRDQRSTPRCP